MTFGSKLTANGHGVGKLRFGRHPKSDLAGFFKRCVPTYVVKLTEFWEKLTSLFLLLLKNYLA